MTPTSRGSNYGAKNIKLIYFIKNILYPGTLFRQTKYKVMMTKEESTKIVNSMTLMTVVLVLGRGHISHIVNMHYFFKSLGTQRPFHWIRRTPGKLKNFPN